MVRHVYSSQEYCDIHFIYGWSQGNATRALREYVRRFPERRRPDRRVFERTHRRLAEGTLFQGGVGRVPNVENDDDVLDVVRNNRRISVRNAASMLGLPASKVWRVLKRDGQHPYHFTTVQDLIEPIDPRKRLQFCQELLQRRQEAPNFFKRILWTDESTFTRNGIVNFHNDHIWSHENPHGKKTKAFQHKFSVNVWAGIIGDTLIGPIILPDRLNGENYLQFLRTVEPELLDDVPLATRQRGIIYQQDGAPAHYALAVRNWLNINYPDRWIGRDGPILWPPRSPDLTPLDFYLWGFMKAHVYAVRIETKEQLVDRIRQAGELARGNLRRIYMTDAIKGRLEACVRENGGHFEHLL